MLHVLGAIAYGFVVLRVAAWLPREAVLTAAVLFTGLVGMAGNVADGFNTIHLSLGDTARFLFGGVRRRDPVESFHLESGDAFVFGGPARLRYHGVTRIMAGTAPAALSLDGRFNLTFRQY